MDLYKGIIQDLYAEKEKLARGIASLIASLEELQRIAEAIPMLPKSAKRRGRKFMNARERQEVAERMRKYWASRRNHKAEQQAGHQS
jgi:hypothetical protein